MGRGKHEQCWEHVTRVENENKWICKYCKKDFGGGATRIEAHLGLNGKGGNIRRCSNYPPVADNEGVLNNNNMASTSRNPPHEAVINRDVYSTQDHYYTYPGVPEVIGTHTRSSANNPNNVDIVNLFQGKKLIMGRKKNEDCRKHVTELVENGHNYWICNYCNNKFGGGASRIEAHLGGKGGGIRQCSKYPPVAGNEGFQNNNMASTSSNPPPEAVINRLYSTQDQGLFSTSTNLSSKDIYFYPIPPQTPASIALCSLTSLILNLK